MTALWKTLFPLILLLGISMAHAAQSPPKPQPPRGRLVIKYSQPVTGIQMGLLKQRFNGDKVLIGADPCYVLIHTARMRLLTAADRKHMGFQFFEPEAALNLIPVIEIQGEMPPAGKSAKAKKTRQSRLTAR